VRRARHSHGAVSFGTVLSLACLVLGIGLIAWASVGIAGEYGNPAGAVSTPKSAAASRTVEPTRSAVPATVSSTPAPQPVVYSAQPKKGDRIGSLSIPALGKTLPIIEGTDAAQLKQGVGHFIGSALPGANDNCVLSGHRDTVFTGLGRLKVGDQFIVETAAGTFTYKVKRIRIVHKDDQTVIVPIDHAVLTVTTCYPFNYIGSAPDRYILSADMVRP
jgi:sortase A